jgi:hypothetical protein
MLNQAVAGFPYKILGGQAVVGNPQGLNVTVRPLTPITLPDVFVRAAALNRDHQVSGYTWTLPPMPPLNSATIKQFRKFIVVNKVSTVLMEWSNSPGGIIVLPYMKAAFGPPQVKDNGMILVWTTAMLDHYLSSATFTSN